ncbi:hypothetical protein CPB86DRAFT_796935 [Serendipita vermifera]|nr:hypothetical protein CPB86DRAFT_796935 [Serendipita vermifera]
MSSILPRIGEEFLAWLAPFGNELRSAMGAGSPNQAVCQSVLVACCIGSPILPAISIHLDSDPDKPRPRERGSATERKPSKVDAQRSDFLIAGSERIGRYELRPGVQGLYGGPPDSPHIRHIISECQHHCPAVKSVYETYRPVFLLHISTASQLFNHPASNQRIAGSERICASMITTFAQGHWPIVASEQTNPSLHSWITVIVFLVYLSGSVVISPIAWEYETEISLVYDYLYTSSLRPSLRVRLRTSLTRSNYENGENVGRAIRRANADYSSRRPVKPGPVWPRVTTMSKEPAYSVG